ncbi:hypothetical protein [Burkholderia vietnamiensis]|uniref:hypothetical protein n=1 Tax=Burkholderia vietnamiensis TaxID=60552 RepID=UPI001589B4C4|nr:hypothetical protein [Burkholderia vietnamiensis]
MTTTNKSRADALTAEEFETITRNAADLAARIPGCTLYDAAKFACDEIRDRLAASPVEQHEAAPAKPVELNFGHGTLVVQAVKISDFEFPGIAIYPATQPGEVGSSAKREPNIESSPEILDRSVLLVFPTEEQRDRVENALVNAAAQPEPPAADERAAWQTGAPPVKEGSYAGFIVACRRKHNGEVYVFEANYANQYAEELRDDDGEEFTAHGWYDVAQDIHGEYSSVFSKTCGEGDEIIGWQPLPKWIEESARAASANETGAEGTDAFAHEVWSAAQRAPGEGIEDAVQRIAAILSRSPAMAAEAVAIPAGWKAMPPSATTAMRMAMAEAAAEYMRRTGGNSPDAIYEAGFAAAPQPAQEDARVGLTDEHIGTIAEKWAARWSASGAWNTRRCIDNALREARALLQGTDQ